MKLFRHTYILLSLLLLAGCEMVYDDRSNCPPEGDNVTLLFTRMVGDLDQFQSQISTVDVSVFDERGYLVMIKTVPQDELAAFSAANSGKAGTTLPLESGTYRIVCWGNIGSHSTYANLDKSHTLNEAMMLHTHWQDGVSDSDDNMYYAPCITDLSAPEAFRITVPGNEQVTKTIDFTAAHNTVEVYVSGFYAESRASTDLPEIEITALSGAYNFTMNTLDDKPMNFVQSAQYVTTTTGTIAGAQFYTAHFKNDNPILVHIKDPYTHDIMHTVCMKDFLTNNSITVDPTDHDLIQILVEFIGADVKVSVPNWTGTDVKPNF